MPPKGMKKITSFFSVVSPKKEEDQRHEKKQQTKESTQVLQQQELVVGIKVAKRFGVDGTIYVGRVNEIVDYDENNYDGNSGKSQRKVLYHILYNDGDEEDMDEAEVRVATELYRKQVAPNSSRRSRKAVDIEEEQEQQEETVEYKQENGRRRRKKICYAENYDEDDDIDFMQSDEEEILRIRGNKRKSSSGSSRNKQHKRKKIDSEEAFEVPVSDDEDSDDDLLVLDLTIDESSEDDFEEVEQVRPVSKAKKKAAKKATKTSKGKGSQKEVPVGSSTGARAEDDSADAEYQSSFRKQYPDIKIQNNPQKWPDGSANGSGEYVDPVGVDPTHGIVERIVGAQVRKVGKLLLSLSSEKHLSQANGKKNGDSLKEELSYPIRLQTACSGTDAPSIALGLIKESLGRMMTSSGGGDDKKKAKEQVQKQEDVVFDYDHVMSCEIEPFKQAYIARNFPGVPLFPDITKLSATDDKTGKAAKVVDVYGRPQFIPQGNLFVAGTSCKDFSMLKNSCRKDIEDKGTSGETFLAAVEFLDLYQPPFAIFENVDGAPWLKMQEYITGRIFLGNRNSNKAISSSKRKDNADEDLVFRVNGQGRYEALQVPPQVGMKAGDVVQGFVRDGSKSSNVTRLDNKQSKNKNVTLGQLAKRHGINLERDTLVLEKKARYCTHLSKLDTKCYGLPQTRQRKYLFIWRSDNPDDNLGDYFQIILNHLETPLLHSMEAFLLPDTHDRIRSFREALRSGPGLMVKRDRAKELDFWDWEISRVKDLIGHKIFREKAGLADRMRWLTGWNTRGRKSLAPGLWPELFDCWNMRRLDMIDCFAGCAIRDSISRDPLHHSFTWDLSQNVTRAPYRTASVGVSGCVTPGGELLLPHKGRTVMGYEKLLLQGIPFSRLLLGPETEVQLSDLAGNAMSVSVVSATILSAICAPQLRKKCRSYNAKDMIAEFALSQKHDSANGAVLAIRGDFYKVPRASDVVDFKDVLRNIANDMAADAFRSSVLCVSESSGTMSSDPKILECSCCGLLVSHDYSGRYQLSSHRLTEIDVSSERGRPDPHKFERRLRCAVPSILRLGEGWEDVLEDGEGLESFSFQLQQVERKKGHWQLFYGAWEDHGSGRQVAEIRVIIGRTGTLDSKVGCAAFIRCFAPAIRNKKPLRGTLKDSARLVLKVDAPSCQWEVPITKKGKKEHLKLVGSDPVKSQRALIDLNDKAAKTLKTHKVMKRFVPPVKSRNPLTHYHEKWKTWPGKIVVSGDPSNRVNGTFHKMNCQHTVVLSALWRREDKKMFLFYRPNVIRAALDVAVFSTTPNYHDNLEVCELSDWSPENALVESTQTTKATFLEWKKAPDRVRVEVPNPSMKVINQEVRFHDRLVNTTSEDSANQVLCEMEGLSPGVIQSLLEYNGSTSADVSKIDLLGRSGTRNAKRLSIIASPSFLKSAAEGNLPLDLAAWYKLPCLPNLGKCAVNVPPRPTETWKRRKTEKEDVFERTYDAEESNEYYHRLLNRPAAFQVDVVQSSKKIVVYMNPYVAAHQAAALLGGEDVGSVEVDYCLAELSSMGEPDTKEFHVPNSDGYNETLMELECKLELPLYTRQAKALTRMLAIESGKVHFSEEERSEHVLPGIGWCLIAKASKTSPLRGGVLGDAIGSGKTVVTIALIMKGAKNARKSRKVTEGRSSATLIVVPPGLVKQWDDERKKFTRENLKCIIVDCTARLKKFSVEDICNADIVIVPAGIIEEAKGKIRPYTEHLRKKAEADFIPSAPKSNSQREAPTIEGRWVRNMASGPGIYVGNKGNQKYRDNQAYYGYCYAEAIAKLRQKKFDAKERGVPLEYFTWERIVIDECHETLVTNKSYKNEEFKETARRGAREFLGLAQTDISKRPLVAATGVWGLTGTPLLETEARVTELANLMGGTYLTGAAHHWRKEERESGRDLFLNQQGGAHSREYRCAVQEACHAYVKEACQRNRGETLLVKLIKKQCCVNMTRTEGEKFLEETDDLQSNFAITADQLGEKVPDVLAITASSVARHAALTDTIHSILSEESDTKIIVFADSSYGGYNSALEALEKSDVKFCHVSDDDDSVEKQNEVISWFRHVDATEEDRLRPRVLLLSFVQAAGHNLQQACKNVILYDPVYSGIDAVADASVEEQAVGRVFRQGQKYDVTVTRIIVKGPDGQRCLDDWITERNLDEDVLRAATSNFD